jgi:hypothetical protein
MGFRPTQVDEDATERVSQKNDLASGPTVPQMIDYKRRALQAAEKLVLHEFCNRAWRGALWAPCRKCRKRDVGFSPCSSIFHILAWQQRLKPEPFLAPHRHDFSHALLQGISMKEFSRSLFSP